MVSIIPDTRSLLPNPKSYLNDFFEKVNLGFHFSVSQISEFEMIAYDRLSMTNAQTPSPFFAAANAIIPDIIEAVNETLVRSLKFISAVMIERCTIVNELIIITMAYIRVIFDRFEMP